MLVIKPYLLHKKDLASIQAGFDWEKISMIAGGIVVGGLLILAVGGAAYKCFIANSFSS